MISRAYVRLLCIVTLPVICTIIRILMSEIRSSPISNVVNAWSTWLTPLDRIHICLTYWHKAVTMNLWMLSQCRIPRQAIRSAPR